MAVEDYLEPEVGVAVAVTAAVASPQVRGVLRRGAVYGLAGVLMAGDALSSLARGVKRGAQTAAAEVTSDAPAGDAPAGDAPAGDAPAGDAPAGDAPAGDAPAEPIAEAAEPSHRRIRKTPEAAVNE